MKNKPRWLIGNNRPGLTAVLITNESNIDKFGDCEVFMIDMAAGETKLAVEGCVEAAYRIQELLDKNNYFKNPIYNYTQRKGNVTMGCGIAIPSKSRAQKLDNRFELFAELLMLNNISFNRPAMGVYKI